ncbi:MAG: DUF4136 domain-containing protein [Cyclobacteriaceae bacterium]
MKKILLGLLVLTVSACSSVKVLSDYDSKAEFKNYKTFEIAPPQEDLPSDPVINQLNGQRVTAAIINQMESRGYELTSNADLVVNIFVKVENRTEQTTTYDGPYFPYRMNYWYYGYWGYYNYWGPGWGYSTVRVRDYKEGTLVVDLVDAKTKKLVWHGVAIGDPDNFRKKAEERINNAIEKLFAEFPFRAGIGTPAIVKR